MGDDCRSRLQIFITIFFILRFHHSISNTSFIHQSPKVPDRSASWLEDKYISVKSTNISNFSNKQNFSLMLAVYQMLSEFQKKWFLLIMFSQKIKQNSKFGSKKCLLMEGHISSYYHHQSDHLKNIWSGANAETERDPYFNLKDVFKEIVF